MEQTHNLSRNLDDGTVMYTESGHTAMMDSPNVDGLGGLLEEAEQCLQRIEDMLGQGGSCESVRDMN
ncbi:MAG: hypothetical protein ACNI3A_18345 [Desulfovibrio sp.]|uniref:hypothetical protein n=1 Tax=Desulfovibrio sp. 7SRBS1 TaxID=3378064 RepID=UPI003B4258CE